MSVALGGALVQGLDAPRLRAVMRDILNGERRDLLDIPGELAVEPAAPAKDAPAKDAKDEATADASLRSAAG
jgi:hypothetical protein